MYEYKIQDRTLVELFIDGGVNLKGAGKKINQLTGKMLSSLKKIIESFSGINMKGLKSKTFDSVRVNLKMLFLRNLYTSRVCST